MKKMVIADDDFLVRMYLRQLLPWNEYGIDVAGDVSNGREALDLIQTSGADLLLTDICMPVMDGLGLIKSLHEQGYAGHILVLSCHDDFAYVKEAMQLGIDDYLLKNDLTPEAMQDFLKKHMKTDSTTQAPETSGGIKKPASLDWTKLFLEKSPSLRSAIETAGLPQALRMAIPMRLALRGWKKRREMLDSQDIAAFSQTFDEVCQTAARKASAITHSPMIKLWAIPADECAAWALIIDCSALAKDTAALHIAQVLSRELSSLIQQYFDLISIIYIGAIQHSWPALSDSWETLAALSGDEFYREGGYLSASSASPPALEVPQSLQMTGDMLIRSILKDDSAWQQQKEGFEQELVTAHLAIPVLIDWLSVLTQSLNEPWTPPTEGAFPETIGAFLDIWSAYLDAQRTEVTKHPLSVRQALLFINEHYRENISLGQVAEYVHLSPAYFSTIFKRYLGQGFSEYLALRRLSAVRGRLVSGTERIKDIAESEGFTDYQYFCRLFKRVVGVSPSVYRKQG